MIACERIIIIIIIRTIIIIVHFIDLSSHISKSPNDCLISKEYNGRVWDDPQLMSCHATVETPCTLFPPYRE